MSFLAPGKGSKGLGWLIAPPGSPKFMTDHANQVTGQQTEEEKRKKAAAQAAMLASSSAASTTTADPNAGKAMLGA